MGGAKKQRRVTQQIGPFLEEITQGSKKVVTGAPDSGYARSKKRVRKSLDSRW